MRKVFRTLSRLMLVCGILLLLLVAGTGGALWLTLPADRQTAHIPGLSAPVDIGIDSDGIPRIHAATDLDAAAALGFMHARDRMFQMELMRRAASGRLSEIAGPATLPIDRLMRTLGLRRSAITDLGALPPETLRYMEAYASGVNTWIAEKGRFAGPEFLILGPPEPWLPVDSLLWAKTMGLWLSSNWHTELARLALAGRVPQDLIDQLWPDAAVPRPDASLPPHVQYAAAAGLPTFPDAFTLPGTASNEWAVDGTHTATGAPLLAGDPHLGFGFPAIWYLARIETPNHVLAGATAPGVPFLVLGHNERIAWTFTTTGADTQDVFIEDTATVVTTREERIKIRGQPDELLTVRETSHGPVISDLNPQPGGPLLAVAMANLLPNDTAAAGLLALNKAQTVAEAGLAAPIITSPVQNLLVADKATIGLFVTGRVPVRRSGDGSAPVSGDGSHDWIGWASGTQLPQIVAPASGRLVNGNEPVAGPDFPVFMGRDAFGDWRARRIRALLAASDRHTAADFARMQADVVSAFAQQVLPVLLGVPNLQGTAAQAQALLKGWDGSMTMDDPQPLIFNAWITSFYEDVLRQANIAPARGGPMADFVAYVLTPAGAHWCGGDCSGPLARALIAATGTLTQRFGADPTGWRWGDAHQAVFAHPFLRDIPLLGGLTTIAIRSPGDDSTIDRGGTDRSFTSVHGAAYRGVYDLADPDRSLFVITPGQSGNPLSGHARDFVTRWRDGATVTLGPAATSTTATIRLEP